MAVASFILDYIWPLLGGAIALGAILDIHVFNSAGRITSLLIAGILTVWFIALMAAVFIFHSVR
jgi:hypothetical protein